MNMLRDMLQPARRNMLRGMFTSTSALTRFAVNGVEAALALDFIGGEYRTANTSTTFAEAFTGTSPKLTYSTAAGSNSTMTQGYGPELVENGDFSLGDNGDWVAQADWSITGGAASKTTGTQNSLYQDLTGVSPDSLYEITFDVSNKSGGGVLVFFTGSTVTTVSGNGLYTFIVKASATNSRISFQGQANTTVTIDNISVREAPKLVWAPHNLIRHSEDLSGSTWVNSNVADPPQQSTTVLSPDGSGYAYYIEENTSGGVHYIADKFGPLLNTTWTASVYIKQKDAGVYVQLRPFGVGTGVAYATFSAADGTLYGSGGTELVSAVDGVAVGDGWFKVSMTCTADLLNSNDGLEMTLTNGSGAERPSYTGTGNGVYIWGAHVYRSDLGGMHPVPGAATGFEYYVPTNGNPEYLPRVGHHVYNGSAWVNEGLLIESEPRTNLVTYSDLSSGWGEVRVDISTVSTATAPDGTSNVTAITSDLTPANSHRANEIVANPLSSTGTFTYSAFVRANGTNVQMDVNIDPAGTVQNRRIYVLFDLQAGTAATPFTLGSPNVIDYGIQDAGGGWYRCHVTTDNPDGTRVDVALTLSQSPNSTQNPTFDGDGTSGVYVYGAQLEVGEAIPNTNPVQYKDAPTPSSYMPTNGGTYTRTAQSLTVPPAEFGWPEPEYIGPELVENGDFSLGDNGDWIAGGLDGSSITFNSGVARLYGNALAYQTIPTVAGRVYYAQFEITDATISGRSDFRVGTTAAGFDIYDQTPNVGVGSYGVAFVAASSTTYITLKTHYTVGDLSKYTDYDNVSVREINPLSVSIQMDGRMTYAGLNIRDEVTFVQWNNTSASERITIAMMTDSPNTGKIEWQTYPNPDYGQINSASDAYSPGMLTPFSASGRFGSTFVNGAVDGVAENADNTLTALPDLSGTNLQIAKKFMGTVGQFRQFAGDIGDAGLVTATNPSTEPTLSLSFDGSEGSFYNLSWSE